MVKKLKAIIFAFYSVIFIACQKPCENNKQTYVPMPQPYESWFNAIPPINSDSSIYYQVKSSDSLNQSFIQKYDYIKVPRNNWISAPSNQDCGSFL